MLDYSQLKVAMVFAMLNGFDNLMTPTMLTGMVGVFVYWRLDLGQIMRAQAFNLLGGLVSAEGLV